MKKLQIFIILSVFSVFCYAQTTRPVVSDMSATFSSENNAILISWIVPDQIENSIKELLVFRTNGQFITSSLIDELTPIAIVSPSLQKYTDTVKEAGNYYYAIVAKMTDEKLYSVIIPTLNATTSPVTITPVVDYAVPEKEIVVEDSLLREKPLANLQLFDKDKPQEEKIEIPSSIIESTNSLVKTSSEKELLEPTLLKEDVTRMTKTQDDGVLFSIIDNFLVNLDWLGFKKDLEGFLEIERTENAECRAWFYLGQIAYLQKDYRLAIRYFQYAQKCYPTETIKWIDDSLMLFEI